MSNPYLSVILPFYNAQQTIEDTIKSLLEQNFFDMELILIDDGSTDETYEIASRALENAMFSVKMYRQQNGGAAKAKNEGIVRATGDFVMFIDADDLWAPKTIDTLQKYQKKGNYDFISFNFRTFNEIKELDVKQQGRGGERVTEMFTSVWNKMVSKNLIKSFMFPEVYYEDVAFAAIMYLRAKKVGYLNQTLYFYRQQSNSLIHTKQNLTIQKSVLIALNPLKKEIANREVDSSTTLDSVKLVNSVIFSKLLTVLENKNEIREKRRKFIEDMCSEFIFDKEHNIIFSDDERINMKNRFIIRLLDNNMLCTADFIIKLLKKIVKEKN